MWKNCKTPKKVLEAAMIFFEILEYLENNPNSSRMKASFTDAGYNLYAEEE